MQFDSLCKNKIFKDVPDLKDIKVDKHMKKVFRLVFTGMGGRYTRMRIICAITENPMNKLKLSKELELDYKTIKYNIKVLERNDMVIRDGHGYGDTFFPSDKILLHLPTLYSVIRNVEVKLAKPKKKYID